MIKIKEKEELEKLNLGELKNLKKEIEKELDNIADNIANDPAFSIANSIEEEDATKELMDEMVQLDDYKQDLLYYLDDVEETIKLKEEE